METSRVAQNCSQCTFWKVENTLWGSCYHPIMNVLRGFVEKDILPDAVQELEVSFMRPTGGKYCPTFEKKVIDSSSE